MHLLLERALGLISKAPEAPEAAEEVAVVIHSRVRSANRMQYVVIFEELEGRGRIFTNVYDWYGPGGKSAPRPYPGQLATIRVNRHGDVV